MDGGPPQSVWETQQRLSSVAQLIRTLGTRDAAFSGVSIDADTESITVFRVTRKSPISEDRYRALTPDRVQIIFGSATLSETETRRLIDHVWDNREWLTSRGIYVNVCHTPAIQAREHTAALGPIEIVFDGPGDPDAETLDRLSLYGANTVTFVRGHAVAHGIGVSRRDIT